MAAIPDELRKVLVRMADGWKPNGLTFSMYGFSGDVDPQMLVQRGLVVYHDGGKPTRHRLTVKRGRPSTIKMTAGKDYYEITDKGRRAAAQFRGQFKKPKGRRSRSA